MRRRWAAQANQRQAQSAGNAAPGHSAQPCIDLSTQVTESASLAPALPDTLEYGDASLSTDNFGDIAPTQLDSPCISVSSTEDVEIVPPAPPSHSAALLSLAASSKHPQHSTGASSLSVPKLLSHGPLPTVADLAVPPPALQRSPARVAMYPSQPPTPPAFPNPSPLKKTRTAPPLTFGGLPVPPPPAVPLSLTRPQKSPNPPKAPTLFLPSPQPSGPSTGSSFEASTASEGPGYPYQALPGNSRAALRHALVSVAFPAGLRLGSLSLRLGKQGFGTAHVGGHT